jgi:dTDP-glucose 4,6-dehydratase
LTIFGNGEQTRSFCYISDLIEGVYKLLISDENMPVNIGNPEEKSINEFAEIINNLTQNSAGANYLPDMHVEGDPMRRQPDVTRANNILGWSPKVSLEEGLKLTIEYFKKELT